MTNVSTDRRRGVNAGKAIKVPCRVATTAAITLSGEQTIDGIACVSGDRVLVKNQLDAVDHGIYSVSTSGWRREPDWNGVDDITDGTLINITSGTVNESTIWQVETAGDLTPSVTSVSLGLTGFADIGPLEEDIAQLQEDVAALQNQEPGPDPDPLVAPTWAISLDADNLIPNRVVFNYTVKADAAWAETIDTAVTPTYPSDFTAGDWRDVAPVALPNYTTTQVRRFYQYDSVDGIVEALDQAGNSGVTLTPTRTDETPDDVTFTSATGVAVGTAIGSNSVTISGLSAQNSITISGGEYSLNGSSLFTSADGVIVNTDTVVLRTTSSPDLGTETVVTVVLGNRTETWSVTTTSADTVPPERTSDALTLTLGTDTTTQVDYIFTVHTDADSGPDLTRHDFIDSNTGLLFRTVSAVTGTLSNLTPGQTYNWFVRSYDLASSPNFVDTVSSPITLDSSSGGEVNFTLDGATVPADTVAEDAGSVTISLTRTVTDQGDQTVTVSTTDGTAGAQITGLTASTVTFTASSATATKAVTLTDINADATNRFGISIDLASGGGATPPTIGDNNSLLIDVTGTGSGVGYPLQSSAGDHILSIWLDPQTSPPADTISLIADANGWLWASMAKPGGLTGTDPVPTASNLYHQDWRGFANVSSTLSPRIQITGEFTQTGTHYLWAACYQQETTRDAIWGSFDDTDNTSDWRLNGDSVGMDTWHWIKWPGSFNITSTGVHTVEIGGRFYGDETDGPIMAAILVTDNASYTATGTVAESSLSSTPPDDNPDNPPDPPPPVPGDVLAPTALYPTEAHEHTSLDHKIRVTYDGSQISNVSFTVTYNSGTNTIAGTSTSNSQNIALFYPSEKYPANTTISWTVAGSILDSTGAVKSIAKSGTFKSLNPNDAAILLNNDFIGRTPHVYTSSDRSYWNALTSRDFGFSGGGAEVDVSTCPSRLTDAFTGENASRGVVFMVTYPAGAIQKGMVWGSLHADAGSKVYISYDLYIEAARDWVLGGKLMCGAAGGYSKYGDLDPFDSTPGFSARCDWMTNRAYSNLPGIMGCNILTEGTTYDDTGRDKEYVWCLSCDEIVSKATSGYELDSTPDQWIRIQNALTMNSDDTADGILECWVDGTKVMNLTGRQWRENAASGVIFDVLMMSSFYGGGSSLWAPNTTQYALASNFVVSTESIDV